MVDGEPARWRWTSGRRPFYVPLADRRRQRVRSRVNGEPVVGADDVPTRQSRRLLPRAPRRGGRVRPRRPRRRPVRPAAPSASGSAAPPRCSGPRPCAGSAGSPPSSSPTTRTPTGACGPGWPGMRILYDPDRHGAPPPVGDEPGPALTHGALPGPAQRPAVPGAQRARATWPDTSCGSACTRTHGPELRRAVLTKLPWALASRAWHATGCGPRRRARLGSLGRRRHGPGTTVPPLRHDADRRRQRSRLRRR